MYMRERVPRPYPDTAHAKPGRWTPEPPSGFGARRPPVQRKPDQTVVVQRNGAGAPAAIAQPPRADLAAQRARFADIRNLLPRGFWNLDNLTPALEERASEIDSFQRYGRRVPGIATPAEADQALERLAADIDAILDLLRNGPLRSRIVFVSALYSAYANQIPEGQSLSADIWAPLLGSTLPDRVTLLANLARAEDLFGGYMETHLNRGAAAGPLTAEQAVALGEAFVRLWSLGRVRPRKRKGFDAIYKSSFDQNRGDLGVSWDLSGIQGWVLHGHAVTTVDATRTVTSYQLPSLHIKPQAAAFETDVSIEIDDDSIKQDLIAQSRDHLQAIARSEIKGSLLKKQRVASERRKKNRPVEAEDGEEQ